VDADNHFVIGRFDDDNDVCLLFYSCQLLHLRSVNGLTAFYVFLMHFPLLRSTTAGHHNPPLVS
jgi:hypothetical protein